MLKYYSRCCNKASIGILFNEIGYMTGLPIWERGWSSAKFFGGPKNGHFCYKIRERYPLLSTNDWCQFNGRQNLVGYNKYISIHVGVNIWNT